MDFLKNIYKLLTIDSFSVITVLLILNALTLFIREPFIEVGQAIYSLAPEGLRYYLSTIDISFETILQLYQIILLFQTVLLVYLLLGYALSAKISRFYLSRNHYKIRILSETIATISVVFILIWGLLARLSEISYGPISYFNYLAEGHIINALFLGFPHSLHLTALGLVIWGYFYSEEEPKSRGRTCPLLSMGKSIPVECSRLCMFYVEKSFKINGKAKRAVCTLQNLPLKLDIEENVTRPKSHVRSSLAEPTKEVSRQK